MKCDKFGGRGYAANSYIVYDDATTSSAVIDPTEYNERFLSNYPRVTCVLLTHGHFDHILALDKYVRLGIPVYVGTSDADMLTDSYKNASSYFLGGTITVDNANVVHVKDKEEITVGREKLTVIETPGHTDGSVCYYCKDSGILFSGDTVFAGGDVGRCDLYSGNKEKLENSVKKLMSLPDKAIVFPGHGKETSIFAEKCFHI
ncbi:MAG: MBL fold metallo-hydrolase [Eubacteriales bacterium]|nr:MBL fold metallo-hydrolase [Eubacteriales bacterium]